ncbi:hypothetical protein OIV83_002806 [Microbotryomycetes sp. JL201]|nr:hypothetical protein OIV83_002806 [Microbotryomycetes sp. JL201]
MSAGPAPATVEQLSAGSRGTRQPRARHPSPAQDIADAWAANLRRKGTATEHALPQRHRPGQDQLADGSRPQYRDGERARSRSRLGAGVRGAAVDAVRSDEPRVHAAQIISDQDSQANGYRSSQADRPHQRDESQRGGPQSDQHRQPHLHVKAHNRHRIQTDRVYAHPRYDADFDRGAAPSRQAAQRTLFDPNAPAQATAQQQLPKHSSSPATIPRQSQENSSLEALTPTQRSNRSKREPVNPLDLGRRVATGRNGLAEHESRESIESEDSVVSRKSKTGSKSSRDGIRPRRSRKDESMARQRLDDDASIKSVTPSVSSAAAASNTRQLFDPRRDDPVRFSTHPPQPSVASRGEMRNGASSSISLVSVASTTAAPPKEREAGSRHQQHPVVAQLKDLYRHITALENQLQEEHRIALSQLSQDEEIEHVVTIKGSSKRFDDEYWAKLALQHKELADLHYSFMQMALDPQLPASMQALPQKYNIPSRLWQTAFHQLLERMRYAIVSPRSSHTPPETSPPASILEHLIEFIQYGYGHYSQLFEDPTVAAFRAAWIEQLGDLARYRMAVAGLSARISAAQRQKEADAQRLDVQNGLALLEDADGSSRPADQASIGVAALNDWDVEEQDSWRTIARDWYSQGITENPGSGRLHHHLALLSKGDELRCMYHFAKSLTTSHPYASARESILPLFEEENQARRTRSEVSKSELFVHLHGMLFTKIALDNFEEVAARFMEKLKEEGLLLARTDGAWSKTISGVQAPFDEGAWMMLAVVNIAALMQYGAEDGVLRPFFDKDLRPSTATKGEPASKAPQAIIVHSSPNPRPVDGDEHHNGGNDKAPVAGTPLQDVVLSLKPNSSEDDPLAFRYAQQLTFDMLDLALAFPARQIGSHEIANPYIVLILTFISQLSQHRDAMIRLERYIPWQRLAEYLSLLLAQTGTRLEASAKLSGRALPEDWCIRGLSWTNKHMFARGFFQDKSTGDQGSQEPPASAAHGEADALSLSLFSLESETARAEAGSSIVAGLAEGRRQRVLAAAGLLVRNVAGFDFETSGDNSAIRIGPPLQAKLARWKQSDEDAAEAVRLSRLSLQAKDRREEVEEFSDETESEEESDDDSDSPELKELKARRRHLKAVVRQARNATRGQRITSTRRISAKGKKDYQTQLTLKIVPGYTVLVFDTNVILSSLTLLQGIVESATWTVVVPLAVITELDGLKRNETNLGSAAQEAILYLETAVKTCSRVLKVQTSRGNYLHDLTIRSEAIDFASSAADGDQQFSHESARSMDDVILRAVAWQQDHFTNRMFMLNPAADRSKVAPDSSKVVLITFDRNLRLKARARGLDAADEKEMVPILSKVEARGNG